MSEFSKVFKNLRKDNNLTQSELAKKLGVATSTVGMYERAQREPDFETLEKILKAEEGRYDAVAVDFHAEATSEKQALAFMLDGKVTAVFGTHTHVATADERLLDKGSGYITDVGMCGVIDSVIGAEIDTALQKFVSRTFTKKKQPAGKMMINGVIFTVDDQTHYCTDIKRIKY